MDTASIQLAFTSDWSMRLMISVWTARGRPRLHHVKYLAYLHARMIDSRKDLTKLKTQVLRAKNISAKLKDIDFIK